MRKITFGILSIILFVLLAQVAKAQFVLDAEFRPRGEYNHGYKSLASEDQNPSFFTTQRTRLNLRYKNDKIETKLTLQDVRLWGNQKQLVANDDFAVSIHEAWAQANFCKSFAVRVGRQELVYDNHRIFGNVGWAQQARSHDLALLKYKGVINVDLGVAYNQDMNLIDNTYTGPDAYKAMQFLWLNKKFDNFKISLLFLNNGKPYNVLTSQGDLTKQEIRYSQTFGPFFAFDNEKLIIEANAYYQTGKTQMDMDISAYEAFGMVGYRITDMFNVKIGYEILSGMEGTDNEVEAFNPFYGTNHKFNGHMDYFFVGNHINSYGLQDAFLKLGLNLEKIKIGVDAHYFLTASEIPDDKSSSLGTEIDAFVKYPFSKQISFQLGYSHMFGEPSLQYLKGGSTDAVSNWAYLMLTFKPVFFKK